MSPPLDEALLDDEARLGAADARGTLRALATAGAQVRTGVRCAREAGIGRVAGGERPRSVLVASLAGSAVVADVLELLAGPGSPVPVWVRRNVPLPGWVGALDLVIAVSESGRAAGPLALAAEAARRGAWLLTVGAPDSPLADICARAQGVHVEVARTSVSARTALWALLTPVLVASDVLGLASVDEAVLARVADRLDAVAEAARPSSEAFVNPAKSLALDLAGGVPAVLGDGPLAGVAAARTAAMLARTSRVPATWGELADGADQIVACFDGPFAGRSDPFADPFLDPVTAPSLRLVLMRDQLPGTALADAVEQTARESAVAVSTLHAEPGHPVERLADLIALTDYASTYLALAQGFDPTVSAHVADLRDHTDRGLR
ncbi:MAG TPA: SIS domain-containing protein [Candidatus Lustribacter sp.]|nr:SIS domain-containing protein [Candidatus Lustribacter sp.]